MISWGRPYIEASKVTKIHFLMFSEIPKDEEFLEAVISAMRSLLQMIASKNISQVQDTPQPFLMTLSGLLSF